MKKIFILLMILNSVLLMSCSEEGKSSEKVQSNKMVSSTPQTVSRNIDPIQYSQGQKLFQQNCSVCHGAHGEGAKNWRTPDEQGKNPAPPLNGTGHTWHHSNNALTNVIRNGTGKIGGNMPAWKDTLSDREIKLILTWIKAQWPDELYTAWYNRFHQK